MFFEINKRDAVNKHVPVFRVHLLSLKKTPIFLLNMQIVIL